MRALTPQLSFERLLLVEVSLLISIELLNIPSPTTAFPFHLPQFDTLPGLVTVQVVSATAEKNSADLWSSWAASRDQRFAIY